MIPKQTYKNKSWGELGRGSGQGCEAGPHPDGTKPSGIPRHLRLGQGDHLSPSCSIYLSHLSPSSCLSFLYHLSPLSFLCLSSLSCDLHSNFCPQDLMSHIICPLYTSLFVTLVFIHTGASHHHITNGAIFLHLT